MTTMQSLIGTRFGRLTVISLAPKRRRRIYWLCRCDCGKEKEVFAGNLRAGQVRSCGCLSADTARERNTTHGMTGTPTFKSWYQMVLRCTNPVARGYARYGSRGIKVCERWLGADGFTNFLTDMGERPSSVHTIDRFPDNNGSYSPENCRWAIAKEQANNRRDNRLITCDGVTKNVSQWAECTGIKRVTINQRLRNGWAPKEALTRPPNAKHRSR